MTNDVPAPVDETPDTTESASPFETEKVDGLVYRQSTDAPETRAAAANIHQFRDIAPPPKRFQNIRPTPAPIDGTWVPLDIPEEPAPQPTVDQVSGRSMRELVLAALVTVVPMGLIFVTVIAVYRWFGFA